MTSTNSFLAAGSAAIAIVAIFSFSQNRRAIEKPTPPTGSTQVEATATGDPAELKLLREKLKADLKLTLSKHDGCTKNEEVVELVEKLAAINPIPRDCASMALFQGEFATLSAPPFPGMIRDEKTGLAQFTLGRLSFNIFQPKNLLCTVKSIRNPVYVDSAKSANSSHTGRVDDSTFQYNFVIDLVIHTSPDKDIDQKSVDDNQSTDLEATMITTGFCRPSPDVDNRMIVTFTGSSLIPKPTSTDKSNELELLWNKNFENAYSTADKERTYMGWVVYYGLKWFLGLNYPEDATMDNDFKCAYEMKKPVKSHFDVLYLDEDIRITKGGLGTTVVVNRIHC